MDTNEKESITSQQNTKEQIKAKFLADKARFITAGVLIVALILILSIDSTLLTCIVLAIICLIGVQESLKLYALPPALHYYIATAFIWVLAYFNERIIESILKEERDYRIYRKHFKNRSRVGERHFLIDKDENYRAILEFMSEEEIKFLEVWLVLRD